MNLADIDRKSLLAQFKIINSHAADAQIRILPLDINADSVDEMVLISNDTTMQRPSFMSVFRLESPGSFFQCNFHFHLSTPTTFDIDNDGYCELFICESSADGCQMHIINHAGELMQTFLIATNKESARPERKWFCSADVENVYDINNDGYRDLLLTVATDYACQPRGIYAYDWYNKRYLWKYFTSFIPVSLHLADIEPDNKMEIICGSNSPANCGIRHINGSDDSHNYMLVLNLDGQCELLHPIEQNNGTLYLYLHDLTGDGIPELVGDYRPIMVDLMTSLKLWDPHRAIFFRQIHLEKILWISSMNFYDINDDGIDDIMMGWQDGTLECCDNHFRIIRQRTFPGFIPNQMIIVDLNNDGLNEFYAFSDLS